MRSLSLSQKLVAGFTLMLVLCCAVSGWLQIRTSKSYSQAVIQQLSLDLASHIAQQIPLMRSEGIDQNALKSLFSQTMVVNPSVEVYLLDTQGNIIADAAPSGHVKRQRIDLAPLHQLQSKASLPVLGDDPRSESGSKVFSAAPLTRDGKTEGWLYVILLGEDYNQLASDAQKNALLMFTLSAMGLLLLLTVIAGAVAFRWVTRPMRQLIKQVAQLDQGGMPAIKLLATQQISPASPNEVSQLQQAFAALCRRINEQWDLLAGQDQQRREFIANISHDLRTPLTAMHGYLETLTLKSEHLTQEERQRYLSIALSQSQKVGGLAQQLFELARLEHGGVKPNKERFSLGELAQDVWQKFELTTERRQIQLRADIAPHLPLINADLSMMERVLTNLLDNAIRHSPDNSIIHLRLWVHEGMLSVSLHDQGPGIPAAIKTTLFHRPSVLNHNQRNHGGLGLMIVQRMLQLHGGNIRLGDEPEGASFCFALPLS